MKKVFFLLFLLNTGLHLTLPGQTSVEVSGIIKSSQGALQGAEVAFFDINDEFQGNCISGPDGKFKSQNKMPVGKTIKIKVIRSGYETYERMYRIDRIGNAGEFMIQRKILTISGFIKDSISELPLPGVEIFFYDESKLIQSKSTNSLGYFDLETPFTYGQRITVKAFKQGYYDKEQTLTFTSEGRNTLQDILLPQFGDRGLKAYIRIKDEKRGKALGGVSIHYFDSRKSLFKDTLTSSGGEQLELKLNQRPGTTLDLEIRKTNYRTIKDRPTLSEDPLKNVFEYRLIRDRRSTLGPLLLIGSGASVLLSGGLYLSSNSKYDSYKDFANVNRESDYTSAQNNRNMSAVTAAVAAGALVTFIIYRMNQKKKENALGDEGKRVAFNLLALSNQTETGNKHGFSFTYQF